MKINFITSKYIKKYCVSLCKKSVKKIIFIIYLSFWINVTEFEQLLRYISTAFLPGVI